MRTKLAVLSVAVVAAISLMFAGVATAGTPSKTIVTIKGPNGDFHGKIKSRDAGCRGDRLVRLFMSDSADGPFERTGNWTRPSSRAPWACGRWATPACATASSS